ncbi:MAG TPA: translation elongation factor Ts [Anaerovoracaceae bacterium]|nr:translation elongation factor Ts [Anaerovoracaceae bacterium]
MSIQAIKELRERTHLGMTECKSALDEAQGDVEKAVEILQKRGSLKKADSLRETREGLVRALVVDGVGKIAELNCETDFAAKSELFSVYMNKVLTSPEKTGISFESLLEEGNFLAKQLGEGTRLRKFDFLKLDNSVIAAYNHHSGKIAVLLGIVVDSSSPELLEFADELAMQIAANNPLSLDRSSMSDEIAHKQLDLFESQAKDQFAGKPQQMIEKIINGKMDKWYQENCLMEQESIVHPKQKISVLADSLQKKLNIKFSVSKFVRYELGA